MEQLWRSGWFVFAVALFAFAGAISLVWFLQPRAKLHEVRVEVSEKNGVENWDPKGNLPDLEIVVRQDGDRIGSCDVVHDALAGTCTLDEDVEANGTSTVDVTVEDRDSVIDDPIGRASLLVPDEGTQTWSGTGTLRKVEIDVTSIAPAHTRLWPGLLGIVAGVFAALAAWFLILREHLGSGEPVRVAGARAITWLGSALAILGLAVGVHAAAKGASLVGVATSSPVATSVAAGFGAAAIALVALHARGRGPLRFADGVIILGGIGAVFAPVVLVAAAMVVAIALVYAILGGLFDSL